MKTIDDLSIVDKAHWNLHLSMVLKDTPSLEVEVLALLNGGELPVEHPSNIGDWLEKPDMREALLDG